MGPIQLINSTEELHDLNLAVLGRTASRGCFCKLSDQSLKTPEEDPGLNPVIGIF